MNTIVHMVLVAINEEPSSCELLDLIQHYHFDSIFCGHKTAFFILEQGILFLAFIESILAFFLCLFPPPFFALT